MIRIFQLGLAAAVALFIAAEVAAPVLERLETVSATLAGEAR